MAQVTFGEWLKRRRKGLGLTQQQLAARINCSTIMLKKLEAEERRPSAQIVEQLANIFNIPQQERASFLRFARGDWLSAPTSMIEDIPWWASAASPRSNLPASLTSFVGREPDLIGLFEYLSDESKRLITLVGPPGVGKTRLSTEAARSVLAAFPDGVFFVALAPLSDPALIEPAILQAIGDGLAKNQPASHQLVDRIGDRHILLVLDNCEHLIEAAAPFVSDLLSACEQLKILATSREALRVIGEWVYPVRALAMPSEGFSLDMETESAFSALTLFVERARAVRPDFALQPDNLPAVASICRQADGLPLAIELLAARTRLLSPQAIVEQLGYASVLYVDGMRARSARQQTLHSAIAWSYDLLTTDEQQLFARLSVFSGGFNLGAAEYIFARTVPAHSVANMINSLLDKSLLQRAVDRSGESRFSMLVTIQQFARDRLGAMDGEANARDGHLAYFLQLAEEADRRVPGPNQQEWVQRLDADQGNFWTALEWCLHKQNTEPALRLIAALGWTWIEHLRDIDNLLPKVHALTGVEQQVEYAQLLNYLGLLYWISGIFESARFVLGESQTLWAVWGVHGERGLAEALYILSLVSRSSEGDNPAAYSLYEQSYRLYQKHGEKWSIVVNPLDLESMIDRQHPATDLLFVYPEGTSGSDHLDYLWELVGRVQALACFFLRRGEYEKAHFFLSQQLKIDESIQSRQRVMADLGNIGELHRYQGDYEQAKECYTKSLAISREHNWDDMGLSFYSLGMVALHQNDYETASKRFSDYFAIARNSAEKIRMCDFLVSSAATTAAMNQPDRAAKLYGAAQSLFERTDYQTQPFNDAEFNRHLQIPRHQLGEARFEELAAEGASMALEDAIAEALESLSD